MIGELSDGPGHFPVTGSSSRSAGGLAPGTNGFPDSAAVVAPPVVIARVENVGWGGPTGGAQESESSWALMYTADYAGHLATRPTWFVRFNMEGEIIQRTELAATLGRGGGLVEWAGAQRQLE